MIRATLFSILMFVVVLVACSSESEVVEVLVTREVTVEITATPANTLAPTITPKPSDTSTPKPTRTPRPTNTKAPTATSPPQPTNIPGPTTIPGPTNTPAPPPDTPVPPMPDVLVLTPLELRDGPAWNYGVLGNSEANQPVQPIGAYGNCSWLQVRTPNQVAGWVPNEGGNIQLNVACETIADGIFRPFTGLIRNTQGDGLGELGISNQTGQDGVVVLATQDNQTVISAYIRDGDSFRMTGIRDGTYVIFFSTGANWNGNQAKFTANVSNQRFDDLLPYSTDGGSYTIWEVTLHGVAGGTASTSGVPSIPPP